MDGLDGKEAEDRLAEVGITVNRNAIPFDQRPPMRASGLRIGTPALTTRGFVEEDLREVGQVIVEALGASPDLPALAARSAALCEKRPLYPGFRGFTTYVA
jgi:glycine hydroxymethyltransferase